MRAPGSLRSGSLVVALVCVACSSVQTTNTPSAGAPAGLATPSAPPVAVVDPPDGVEVDQAAATAAWIGPRGGTLRAVAADGTAFVLSFPEIAVREPTAITMAPIRAVNDLALSGGLAGAVWLEPSGLMLSAPADLRIEPARSAPSSTRPVGFDLAGDGTLGLLPSVQDGTGFRTSVFHFSAAGVGWGTSADLQTLGASAPAGRLSGLMVRFLSYEVPWSEADQIAAFALLVALWDTLLAPALLAVGSDAELEALLADWRQFVFLMNLLSTRGDVDAALALGLEIGAFPLALDPRAFYEEGRNRVGNRIAEAIDGNRGLCNASHDLGALANMSYWAAAGERHAPGAIDWPDAAGGCAGLVVSVANLPGSFSAGSSDTIQLQFALEFTDATKVPADVDATLLAGGFEFLPDGSSQRSAAVAGDTVLSAGIRASGNGPYALGVQLCWVLNGIGRPLCRSDIQLPLGGQVTPPPQTTAPSGGGSIQGCYTGSFTDLSGLTSAVTVASPVCIANTSFVGSTPGMLYVSIPGGFGWSTLRCYLEVGLEDASSAFEGPQVFCEGGEVNPFARGAGNVGGGQLTVDVFLDTFDAPYIGTFNVTKSTP